MRIAKGTDLMGEKSAEFPQNSVHASSSKCLLLQRALIVSKGLFKVSIMSTAMKNRHDCVRVLTRSFSDIRAFPYEISKKFLQNFAPTYTR